MLAWIAENAATIIISAVLLAVVFLIVRGMLKGRIKTCGDCADCGSPCAGCRFRENCSGEHRGSET